MTLQKTLSTGNILMILPVDKVVRFVKTTKDTHDSKTSSKLPIGNESTGVWFLQNKDFIDEEQLEVDFNDVLVTQIPVKFHTDPAVVQAKADELEKWKKFEAYEEVEMEDQHILSTRWVVVQKDETRKIKARLCVRGFEEFVHPQSDSPTASNDSFRVFLAISANEGFDIKSLDVTSAFLQGYPLKRDVFVFPPIESRKGNIIWKLKKSCYGLYDASRKWFMAVKEQLIEFGMQMLSGDDALFFYQKDGKLLGLCILHVDDFLIGGTATFLQSIQKKLLGRFKFGKIENEKFKFTGLNIQQNKNEIVIDQDDYVKSLEPISIDKASNKDEKLSMKKFKEYRRLTGQLSWASENTRPDIYFDVRELSTKNKAATFDDLKTANKVLKKAQLETVPIKFRKLGNWKELKIVAFTDASYRNVENGTKSVGGRFIALVNKNEESSPLAWKSKTIQQVCKSVKTAETRSLEIGMEDSIYLAKTIHEIYTGKPNSGQIPIEVKIDSKTLIDSISSTKQVEEKSIRHLVAWINLELN